jgi:hypothetical protein
VDYKWFTKVLTRRLTSLAETLISKTQTAFISGRNILEGVVIVHETLHELRKSKSRWIITKELQWSFLLEVLERELARVWIGWIHQVISWGRVGVNLNGELGNFFKTHKG